MLRNLRQQLSKIGLHFTANQKLMVFSVIAACLISAMIQQFEFNFLESYFYDFRVRHNGFKKEMTSHTVILNIDDKTIESLNEFPPLSIKQHLRVLRKLSQYHPKAIAYFLNFNEIFDPESTSEIAKEEQVDADKFVTLADELYSDGISIFLGTEIDVTGEVVPPFPLSKLAHRVSILHKDGTQFSQDNVTRKAIFSIYDEQVMHSSLANLITGKTDADGYSGIYPMKEIDAKYFYINFAGPTQDTSQNHFEEGIHSNKLFTEISLIDLLENRVAAEALDGKIILIGSKTKENSNDYVYTPFSKEIFSNSKMIVHANIIETLIANKAIRMIPNRLELVLNFLFTFLIVLMVFRTTPGIGLAITTFAAVLVFLLGWMLFRYESSWLYVSRPIISILLAYYIFVPYRLMMEYKKRWNFQKKNEVLLQVEELKGNFMNLITHDLKTPVARIQGMAEILAKSGAEPSIVNQILNSSDELNQFINSILELAKIEGNRIELKKQSKDLNKIIEDCIKKFEYHARLKKIRIFLELEPLFPIHLDVNLIVKVISNLLDNAIKYSPEGSEIKIFSREREETGFIEICVSDNGSGITKQDQENLFTKFYRPKNDLTIKNKGTGLGLYLSRYFVELHEGKLTLESEAGMGSTFIIHLPSGEKKKQSSKNLGKPPEVVV